MENVEKKNCRYQLRSAAGLFWLLDMEQPGVPYKSPLTMNCVGADIWNMLIEGKSRQQIVEDLSVEYEVDKETVEKDAEIFLTQLKQYGVMNSEGELI